MKGVSTRSELLEKIRLGEDQYLELKEVRFAGNKISGPKQQEIANELAAFANSEGGEMLLGVEDKGKVVLGIPLEKLDFVEDLVRQACTDSTTPAVTPTIERITLPNELGDELPVIRVRVQKSLFVHQSPAGYLHRIGSAKKPMQPDHLARLFQQRSQSRIIRFDETPVLAANGLALQPELYLRFLPASAELAEHPVFLQKLAMLVQQEENADWHPTVAGVLMATSEPEKYLPHAYIQAIAYAGVTRVPADDGSAYQLDAQNITGPLDQQIFKACDFVEKNMQVAARKGAEGGRIDLPQYDMLAVFEAITNAVAHRDYSMAGVKIRLHMFSDRLEIYTPGMLPNTMSTESLAFRQAARNEVITSLLARCPTQGEAAKHRKYIMDKRGEGVPIIIERSKQLSGKMPIYKMHDSSELQLTIYAGAV